MNKKGITNIH